MNKYNNLLRQFIDRVGLEEASKALLIPPEELVELLADQQLTKHLYEKEIEKLKEYIDWFRDQYQDALNRNMTFLELLQEYTLIDETEKTGQLSLDDDDILNELDEVLSENKAFTEYTAEEVFTNHQVNEKTAEIKQLKVNTTWRSIAIAASMVAVVAMAILVIRFLPSSNKNKPVAQEVGEQMFEQQKTRHPRVVAPKSEKALAQRENKPIPPQVVQSQKPVQSKQTKKKTDEERLAFNKNKVWEDLIAEKNELPEGIVIPTNLKVFKTNEKIIFSTSLEQKAVIKIFANTGEKLYSFKLQKGKIAEIGIRNLSPGRYYIETRLDNTRKQSAFLIK